LTQCLVRSEVFKCVRCGSAVYAYGDKAVCSRCGATYVKRFTYKVTGAFKVALAEKIQTKIDNYGVTSEIGWPPLGYPAPGVEPTPKTTFTTAEGIVCFGRLKYYNAALGTWLYLGDKPINITVVDSSGRAVGGTPTTVKTGGWYGEFSYHLGKLPAGDYSFAYEFPGDETYAGCEGNWVRSPAVLQYRRLRIR